MPQAGDDFVVMLHERRACEASRTSFFEFSEMIKIPAFKAHLHAQVMPGEGVLVLSEDATSVLYGAAYEKIAPLVDGVRSTDDIVDALNGQMKASRRS